MNTVKNFRKGDRVKYVPYHADGNEDHPDCEFGVVSSVTERALFVKYNNDRCIIVTGDEDYTSKSTKPSDLRLLRPQWIPIEKENPDCLQVVMAFGVNEFGLDRIAMAIYIPPKSVLSEDFLCDEYDTSSCEEYDEEKDCYWVNEGFWESSQEADMNWCLTIKITHWMPLPDPPGKDERKMK